MMMFVWLIVGVVIGVSLCIFLMSKGFFIDIVGTLNLDRSDPYDKPYIFLELQHSPDEIFRKKYVILKTTTKNYMTRK